MARPSKYTPETEKRIVSALKSGCSRRDAYEYGGIDERTFANWLKRYSGFSGLVRAAESEAAVMHTANIARAARKGDWKASLEWLKRRRREEWGDTTTLSVDNRVEELLTALFPSDAEARTGEAGGEEVK